MKLSHALFIVLPLCCICLPTVQAAVYSPPADITRAKPLVLDRGSLPVLIRELVREWLPGEQLELATKTDGADARQRTSARKFGTGDWLGWISVALFVLRLLALSGGFALGIVLMLGGIITSIWAMVNIRNYPGYNSRFAMVPAVVGLVQNLLLLLLLLIVILSFSGWLISGF